MTKNKNAIIFIKYAKKKLKEFRKISDLHFVINSVDFVHFNGIFITAGISTEFLKKTTGNLQGNLDRSNIHKIRIDNGLQV